MWAKADAKSSGERIRPKGLVNFSNQTRACVLRIGPKTNAG